MFRSLLERLSRGVVLKRRFPAGYGGLTIFVSPDASLKYWNRDLRDTDASLLNAAKFLVRRGDVVWDVGANVGLFSIAAAGLAGPNGRVLAMEPDPWLSGLLRRSAALNEGLGYAIEVLPAAVGDRGGNAVLNIAQRGRATNFVEGHRPSSQTGGTRSTVSVPMVTLDELLDSRPPPSVLKIDVEGAEASVLKGARRMLGEVRPRILCEVSAANREAVSEILRSASYDIYDAESPVRVASRLDRCAWNTVALPTESPISPNGSISAGHAAGGDASPSL